MDKQVSVSELFSRDEIQQLTQASNWQGLWAVLSTWAIIFLTLASVALCWQHVAWWGKLLLCILALIIIAGRQLALAILMHDASHRSLFKNPMLNDYITDWLCARPIWNDLQKYRAHHMRHHAKTSLPEDPDLSLVAGFPTSKASRMRKFARDIVGITGLKFAFGRLLMDLGVIEWTVANQVVWIPANNKSWLSYARTFLRNSAGAIICNALLFLLLWTTGYPWLYLLWVVAYLTPFPLFIRIRSMAEHADRPSSLNTLINTRSVHANFIARSLVAPIHVNYHMEHHLMASVPYFKLPHMHHLLRSRDLVPSPPSYLDIIRQMSSAPPNTPAHRSDNQPPTNPSH